MECKNVFCIHKRGRRLPKALLLISSAGSTHLSAYMNSSVKYFSTDLRVTNVDVFYSIENFKLWNNYRTPLDAIYLSQFFFHIVNENQRDPCSLLLDLFSNLYQFLSMLALEGWIHSLVTHSDGCKSIENLFVSFEVRWALTYFSVLATYSEHVFYIRTVNGWYYCIILVFPSALSNLIFTLYQ